LEESQDRMVSRKTGIVNRRLELARDIIRKDDTRHTSE